MLLWSRVAKEPGAVYSGDKPGSCNNLTWLYLQGTVENRSFTSLKGFKRRQSISTRVSRTKIMTTPSILKYILLSRCHPLARPAYGCFLSAQSPLLHSVFHVRPAFRSSTTTTDGHLCGTLNNSFHTRTSFYSGANLTHVFPASLVAALRELLGLSENSIIFLSSVISTMC